MSFSNPVLIPPAPLGGGGTAWAVTKPVNNFRRPELQSLSKIPAAPMPPPTHIVTMP